MLQKILNLFRKKKPISFDERDNYVHDPGLFLRSRPFPSNVDPLEEFRRTPIQYSNPDFDTAYPFPSDNGPDWPSITSDNTDISSNDSPLDSGNFDFGSGTSDGGGATGEY